MFMGYKIGEKTFFARFLTGIGAVSDLLHVKSDFYCNFP